ncbi:hypothetical protein IR083_01615 [Dysgonomonas sp. GY75]|nr:hypothetical protein [Dysgonomonas sp. GY75]
MLKKSRTTIYCILKVTQPATLSYTLITTLTYTLTYTYTKDNTKQDYIKKKTI